MMTTGRFRRLRRACDRSSTLPSLVAVPRLTLGVRLPSDGGRGREGRRVVMESLDEMGLRGDTWRREMAERGRAPKRRRRTGGEPDATAQNPNAPV